MQSSRLKKMVPLLGIALTLSLTACPQESPQTVNSPEVTEEPTTPDTPANTTPSEETGSATEGQASLNLKVQADAALQQFTVQQVQEICVNDLTTLKTTLELPSGADMSALPNIEGVTVEGQKVTVSTPIPNLDALVEGLNINVPNLPTGSIKGTIQLQNAAGNAMGTLSFNLELSDDGGNVTVMLTPVGSEPTPNGCTALQATVSGATLTATAGGLLVELPPDDTEEASEEPDSSPTSTPSETASLPEGLASLRLDVDNRFLTFLGETRQLSVTLLDSDGNPVSQNGVVIEWISNRPNDLSIDTEGNIQALVGLGYAQVTARVAGTNFSDSVLFDITDPSFFTSTGSSRSNRNDDDDDDDVSCSIIDIEEMQLNTETASDQRRSNVAMDDLGNFVVVWETSENGYYYEIKGQRFNAQGEKLGDEIEIATSNDTSHGLIIEPSVAMDADGDFVVVWLNDDYASGGIKGRLFDKEGNANTDEFTVNTSTTSGSTYLGYPDVAMDAEGNFAVTWEGNLGSSDNIYARVFTADGNPLDDSDDFMVNRMTADNQVHPSIAMDTNGDFVISWLSYYGTDHIYAQIFDSAGNALDDNSEFQVSTIPASDGTMGYPDVAMDDDGNFVVVWDNYGNSNDRVDIFMRQYTADGEAFGPTESTEVSVNTYTTGTQEDAAVAMDAEGNFIVIWEAEEGQDGSGEGAYAQRFMADGSPDGDEFRLNETTSADQKNPAIAMNQCGQFMATWSDDNEDGSGRGVFGSNTEKTDPDPS